MNKNGRTVTPGCEAWGQAHGASLHYSLYFSVCLKISKNKKLIF